ncbi:MAG: hypothetical protein Q7R39_19555 [Dehalococcoidia bacterium]|nr:hypothetical protein [Dehalococcoidia bacterium]
MGYRRWAGLDGDIWEKPGAGAEKVAVTAAANLYGEGGYPALFSLTDGLGFFAVGPGEGLLYYFDRRHETAFLFPKAVK